MDFALALSPDFTHLNDTVPLPVVPGYRHRLLIYITLHDDCHAVVAQTKMQIFKLNPEIQMQIFMSNDKRPCIKNCMKKVLTNYFANVKFDCVNITGGVP